MNNIRTIGIDPSLNLESVLDRFRSAWILIHGPGWKLRLWNSRARIIRGMKMIRNQFYEDDSTESKKWLVGKKIIFFYPTIIPHYGFKIAGLKKKKKKGNNSKKKKK